MTEVEDVSVVKAIPWRAFRNEKSKYWEIVLTNARLLRLKMAVEAELFVSFSLTNLTNCCHDETYSEFQKFQAAAYFKLLCQNCEQTHTTIPVSNLGLVQPDKTLEYTARHKRLNLGVLSPERTTLEDKWEYLNDWLTETAPTTVQLDLNKIIGYNNATFDLLEFMEKEFVSYVLNPPQFDPEEVRAVRKNGGYTYMKRFKSQKE